MKFNRKIFAKRLKESRLQANLTQVELGNKSKINSSLICHFELMNDMRTPSIKNLFKLAVALNKSIDYLLGLTNKEQAE